MSFLANYETVNQKVIRLHATYPTNRIETSIIDWNSEKGFILVECRIYRHYEDEKPAAIDYAHGMVGAYNVQMKRWYVEDTVSSAIGRCASVVLGTETKPSLESMEQVEHLPKAGQQFSTRNAKCGICSAWIEYDGAPAELAKIKEREEHLLERLKADADPDPELKQLLASGSLLSKWQFMICG